MKLTSIILKYRYLKKMIYIKFGLCRIRGYNAGFMKGDVKHGWKQASLFT